MPLAVKFHDIDKDILDAVHCGQYESTNNSETDSGDESDKDEDSFDDGDYMTMPRYQVPSHGKGVPLRLLAPKSGANLSSLALLDMLSNTPHAGGVEANLKDDDMLAASEDFINDSGDDLEMAFADW